MSNAYEMMAVACLCPKYMPVYDGFQSSTGEPENKSCINCSNYSEGVCNIDYYDTVAASLDQS
ncbi:hypothetical protein [Clostridium rectalis]|uniref:hypothetical protein n=1 Tax=Clostridium rectalis TaxID=2040295 RepID=UPI000F62E545|nr:hypothetical protein [Clostridium rectalis]